ncbi:hypothetical protein NIES3974_40130 [Calothrix sp. NIES-3974]|nr:hypothetical protein NIES3974_40130 [Calothrix sp. NIES-3974]
MEIIIEANLLPAQKLSDLMMETNEIIAMTVASIKTLKNKSADVNGKSHKKLSN